MACGKSADEARLAAGWQLNEIPRSLEPIQMLANAVAKETKRLERAGNSTEALALAGRTLDLARKLEAEPSGTMIAALVARTIEMTALTSLPADVEIGESGQTAAARLAALRSQRYDPPDVLKAFEQLTDGEIRSYFQRTDALGEASAMAWLEERLAEKP